MLNRQESSASSSPDANDHAAAFGTKLHNPRPRAVIALRFFNDGPALSSGGHVSDQAAASHVSLWRATCIFGRRRLASCL
jgi:hypothetical protein